MSNLLEFANRSVTDHKFNKNTILKLENISKMYPPNFLALNKINIEIKQGDFISIIGKSGSGKSTLLNILGLLDLPSEGEVYFNQKLVNSLGSAELAKIRLNYIGFVFQSFNLLPKLKVWENISLPLQYTKGSKKVKKSRVLEMLNKIGLVEKRDSLPANLSGGQCQRVAIARALINNPSVIIADEPTGSLDSKTGEKVMHLLKQLHEEGKTIILVTHDSAIAAFAQRHIEIGDGTLIHS